MHTAFNGLLQIRLGTQVFCYKTSLYLDYRLHIDISHTTSMVPTFFINCKELNKLTRENIKQQKHPTNSRGGIIFRKHLYKKNREPTVTKISQLPLDPPVDYIDAWLDIRRVAFRLGAASPCGDGEPESTAVGFLMQIRWSTGDGKNHQQNKEVQVILCDLFGLVKWPFQRLSDLQLGDNKVTLNHLGYVF